MSDETPDMTPPDMSSPDMTPETARGALASAAGSTARVRRHARWMSRYLLAFGVGFGVLTLVLGLAEERSWRIVLFVAWAGFVVTMARWSARRSAHLVGTGRRTGHYVLLGTVLYAIALAAGLPDRTGEIGYWAPAAVVVAVPMVVGAVREWRA